MKGKFYVIGLLALIVVSVFGVVFFIQQAKEPVVLQELDDIIHTTVVIEKQPYYAKFAVAIKEKSLENKAVYVKNKAGKTIETDAQIIQGRLLVVPDLPTGNYQLIVEAEALEKRMSHSQVVDFTVYEEKETVASEDDLRLYFMANQQSKVAQNLNDYVTRDIFTSDSSSKDEAASGFSEAESVDYSGTNNQVANIEEGDIAITDGGYLYTIRDQQIKIAQAEPLEVVATIQGKSNGYPTKLMKYDNYLLVFYDTYEQRKWMSVSFANVDIYDVTNSKKPELIRELAQEGYSVGMRMMDGILYMATNKYDIPDAEGKGELRPAIDDKVGDQSYVDYEDISIFPGGQGESYTVISALSLDNPAKNKFETTAYLGGGGQFYMSEQAIYMAVGQYTMMPFMTLEGDARTSEMVDRAWWWQPAKTVIYKYGIDGTKIKQVAEGVVEGSVLNQFSMDEYNGFLRIATTTGSAGMQNAHSNNHVTIFDEQLKQVGLLTDLARGERIYSVRYMGDKAYIVTFKETDPLFVIDVADPKNPTVLGELKIPGFSNYLHPLSETHLIGFGYDTEIQTGKENRVLTQGMKVSLFDVSDVHNPTEVDVELIGGRGTYSDVQHEHKALYRDVANHYYGFPVTIYDNDQYGGTGAVMLEITEQGIALAANLVERQQGEQYENWEDSVRRLLYSGDTLFIISQSKIETYDRVSLKKKEEVRL